MNIIGRLAGGLLIFVGLGWLATLAGLPPFNNRSVNQLTTQQGDATAPMGAASPIPVAKAVAGTPVVPGQTVTGTVVGQTSNGQTVIAPAGTVETAPRDAAAPTPSAVPAAPAAPTPTPSVPVAPAPVAPAAPVPAGW
jgi:hypothetical protein